MRRELREMLTLAWPVILAEIGWVSMGTVDTIMVGPLGPAAIGAVGTGSAIFFALIVLGFGTVYALDTFIATAFGAGRIDECHRWLVAGIFAALVMSACLTTMGLLGISLLGYSGIHPTVLALLQPYLSVLIWSAPLLLLYSVLRRYLQAMNVVRPILAVVVVANVFNAVANWVFVYGHLGVPALGVTGSAYATLSARAVLVGLLALVVWQRERATPSGFHDVPWSWDGARVKRIVRLGLPIGFQIVLEVGVFTLAAVFAGQISPVALAANQVVLNIASFFFMIPLGLSAAAAVRVGHAIGRGSAGEARLAGWSAIGLAMAMAAAVGIGLVAAP
ncbi:MAG: MATE family efflux transporter, partial [Acidobacteriota bacterium]